MKRKLIGFVGYARAGKDTAAEMLIEHGWTRLAFADQLKQDCAKLIGIPITAMNPQQKEFWRPLMVEYGRLRRAQHQDYWIWQVESALKMQVAPDQPVVITDVRYLNECRWILERGGILIYVERDGKPANEEEARSIAEIFRDAPAVEMMSLVMNRKRISDLRAEVYGIATQRLGKV